MYPRESMKYQNASNQLIYTSYINERLFTVEDVSRKSLDTLIAVMICNVIKSKHFEML